MKNCKQCQKKITKPYNVFCNSSCSAKYNNKRKIKKTRPQCLTCGKPTADKARKFCSMKCYGENIHRSNAPVVESNTQVPWTTIRTYLIRRVGKCFECKRSKWRGKKLILQCDHIDGNPKNNVLSNARLLCPNCHSQTDTFCKKNVARTAGVEPASSIQLPLS